MAQQSSEFSGRLLIVAFEGWNDAGEAASGVVRKLKDMLPVHPLVQVDAERYFDYQFNRPVATTNDDGIRTLVWPSVTLYGPASTRARRARRAQSADGADSTAKTELAADAGLAVSGDNASNVYLLLGTEPARSWQSFTSAIAEYKITAVILLGAMLADVPHTRPISIFVSSENAAVREELGVERSNYEGPVGILSVIGAEAEKAGISTVSVWASVPHYVHAIEQLEQARDTVDSPEASGEAIAQEFERYLRKRDGKADGRDRP